MTTWLQIVLMLTSTLLQNASFTLVSRARNSKSILYHFVAATLSNGIWLLVIRQVIYSLDKWYMQVAYLIGSVLGSVLMHIIAMKYFEKEKKNMDKRYKGLSVIVRSKYEFDFLKSFLGEEILYLDWVEKMGVIETSVVVNNLDDNAFSIGSVGSTEYQIKEGFRVVEFKDFFKNEK